MLNTIRQFMLLMLLIYTHAFGEDFNTIKVEASVQDEKKLIHKDAKRFNDKTTGIERIEGKEGENNHKSKPIEKKLNKIFGMESKDDVSKYTKVSLVDVVFETISNNFNVKVAREKVRQAQIKLNDAYSGYKPTLDLEYSNTRTQLDPSDDGRDSPSNRYNDEYLKLKLKQNLYAGGETQYKIKALKKSLAVAQNRYELAISTEIQNAISAYFGVVFSHQSLSVTESNMKLLQKILDIVTAKYDLGAATIGDISSIKASVANAKSKLSKTNSKFVESLKYYEYIAGENFKYTLPYEYNFKIDIAELEKLISASFEKNLNIISYHLTIEEERSKLKGARSGFEPKVDVEFTRTRTFDKDTPPEDFYIQNRTTAMLTVKYNLYNGGKDSNKILSAYSTIREVNYKLEEEKRKLKWIISNLHQSLNALDTSIQSTIDEVESSEVTVESYWEAFKNGEQDLQTLLTAQRQLNSAQVSLIESYQNRLNDYYKLLFETGELISYFELNPAKDNYIDFTKSKYKKQNMALQEEQIDLMTFAKNNKKKNTKELVQKVDTLEDILKFKDKFLDSDDEYYTIYIGKFKSLYDTFNYIKNNNYSKQSFVVDELENYKFKSVLAYGVFETKMDGNKTLESLKKVEDKEYKLVSLREIKDLYKTYIEGYDELKPKELVETKTIKMAPKPPQEFFTNEAFKNTFLSAHQDYYTINLATLSNLDSVVRLLQRDNLFDNTFVFRYGTKKEWIKIVYGVYKNREEAEHALSSLPSDFNNKYFPIIENIKNKQDLFKKYPNLKLGTPTFSLTKGEFVQVSQETKVELRDAKTKRPIKKKNKKSAPKMEENDKKETSNLKQTVSNLLSSYYSNVKSVYGFAKTDKE